MKRQISLTDPAISIVMSAPASDRGGIGGCLRNLQRLECRTQVFPVLGPRVDLLKDGPPRLGTVACALSEGPRFAGCLYIGASEKSALVGLSVCWRRVSARGLPSGLMETHCRPVSCSSSQSGGIPGFASMNRVQKIQPFNPDLSL